MLGTATLFLKLRKDASVGANFLKEIKSNQLSLHWSRTKKQLGWPGSSSNSLAPLTHRSSVLPPPKHASEYLFGDTTHLCCSARTKQTSFSMCPLLSATATSTIYTLIWREAENLSMSHYTDVVWLHQLGSLFIRTQYPRQAASCSSNVKVQLTIVPRLKSPFEFLKQGLM